MHSRSNGQFSVVSAGTIIANIFQLIDGAGNVVGELGQRVIGVNTSPALLMNNSGGPSAGYLGWRYGGVGITYSVVLAGPGAGARLTLSSSGANSDATLFAQDTLTVNTGGTLNIDGVTVNIGSLYNVQQGGYPLVGVHAGIAAARPGSGGGAPPATAGSIYYATDTETLSQYDGTGWVILSEPVTAWTPTVSGLTIGNGFWSTSHYHRSDGWCDFYARFITGTTTVITGRLLIDLPIASSIATRQSQFAVGFYDSGGSFYPGCSSLTGTVTNFWADAVNTAGNYAIANALTPTVPLAWGVGSGHVIDVSGRYPMTTRYS